MINDNLKQLKTRIRIELSNQHLVEHYVDHHRHEYHKLNGPAIIEFDGAKSWLVNNTYHRVDGPAIIGSNSDKYWCIDGILAKKFRYE